MFDLLAFLSKISLQSNMFCSLASLAQKVLPVCTCSVSLASLAQTTTSLAHVLSLWSKMDRDQADVLVFWLLWLKR
jgi:hypothetical protein